MERVFSVLVVTTVVLTVLSLGLVLTPATVTRSLRRGRVVVLALVASVVVVPALAWVVGVLLPLSPPETTGVVLVAVGAGGALGLKTVQLSGRGDVALALVLVVLLEVTDVVAVPTWLRLVAPGGSSDPAGPVVSVAVMVLGPLLLGVAARGSPLLPRGWRRR